MRGKRKSRVPLIERTSEPNYCGAAEIVIRAVHPGSVNAALSAFTSPSLPSLSLTSFKATHEVYIKAVMDHISSHSKR